MFVGVEEGVVVLWGWEVEKGCGWLWQTAVWTFERAMRRGREGKKPKGKKWEGEAERTATAFRASSEVSSAACAFVTTNRIALATGLRATLYFLNTSFLLDCTVSTATFTAQFFLSNVTFTQNNLRFIWFNPIHAPYCAAFDKIDK